MIIKRLFTYTPLMLLSCFFMALILSGCSSRPINEPITQANPQEGYRPYLLLPKRQNNDPETLFVLSFSGGGTRAAAFSYGLLEELRRTNILVNGQQRRLIDEVDLMMGVSGGSFTALAYALHGEQLFSEYEERFLKRNVQGTLFSRALNPFNWYKFIGGSAGRSELAADYYDEILFEGATFGDLLDKQGPVAIATGTDLSTGSRFAFYQNDFDLICSDLNSIRLSRAAATSSAVPIVLSPVTFNNYGGSCNYHYPAWVENVVDPAKRKRPDAHIYRRYLEMKSFQDSESRPFIHLVDGGVSDNIGVRGVLEALEELRISAEFRDEVGYGIIKNIILMVVNAHSAPSTQWDKKFNPPGFLFQLLQSTGVPIDRYSFETIESMKDTAEILQWRRELMVAQKQLAGASKAEAEEAVQTFDLTVIDISFDAIKDPSERQEFMSMPTSFVLPDDDIDQLREIAGILFRQNENYQQIIDVFSEKVMK